MDTHNTTDHRSWSAPRIVLLGASADAEGGKKAGSTEFIGSLGCTLFVSNYPSSV